MEEPFNEGAAQVRRLVQRDRKELLGNQQDILDKYKTEFGDGNEEAAAAPVAAAPVAAASSSAAAPASSSSSPFAPSSSAPAASPFAATGGAAASPFGTAGAASPFGSGSGPALRPSRLASIEPKGLTPDMSPDPIVAPPKDTRSWLAKITLTQVVGGGSGLTGGPRSMQAAHAPCEALRHEPGAALAASSTQSSLPSASIVRLKALAHHQPPAKPLTPQVLFLSFSTIIGIMIATFFVVVNTGAVRLAGID